MNADSDSAVASEPNGVTVVWSGVLVGTSILLSALVFFATVLFCRKYKDIQRRRVKGQTVSFVANNEGGEAMLLSYHEYEDKPEKPWSKPQIPPRPAFKRNQIVYTNMLMSNTGVGNCEDSDYDDTVVARRGRRIDIYGKYEDIYVSIKDPVGIPVERDRFSWRDSAALPYEVVMHHILCGMRPINRSESGKSGERSAFLWHDPDDADYIYPRDNHDADEGVHYYTRVNDNTERDLEHSFSANHKYHIVRGPNSGDQDDRIYDQIVMQTVQHEYEILPGLNSSFLQPAENVTDLYQQLSQTMCLEIPRAALKLNKVAGTGAFGQVFKGLWCSPFANKTVAVKVLKEQCCEEERVKFLQEAAMMKQFKHPRVVLLYGVVTIDQPNMIVLEYLPNGSLFDWLQSKGRKLAGERSDKLSLILLNFCRDVADGMAYLSTIDFLHRDLASRNVLLDKKLKCKIADFGLSRDLLEVDYYWTSGVKIPVRWTAPEVLLYRKYGPTSDVWSYGMLMFEVWSLGEMPYRELESLEVIQYFQEVEIPHLLPPPPGCPIALYEVMVHAWNLDYHKRILFSSIVDLLSNSDQTLLNISASSLLIPDIKDPLQARRIGAPLEHGYRLYKDLQHYYKYQHTS